MKLLIQLIIAFIDCIFLGYISGLMKYKYFSIFKCCYIFGFINVPITMVIYFIVSYIPCKTFYCDVEYENKFYFDNIYSLFKGEINPIEIITYIIYSIIQGGFSVLINETINKYTIFHIFFIYQILEFINDVITRFINETPFSNFFIWKSILVIGLGLIEILCTLVFLEIIELNFCGLDKNLRKKIMNRALIDSEISLINVNIEDDEDKQINDEEEKEQ